MSLYRLQPSRDQEVILLRHCADARFVWNLCVEQENEYRPGRGHTPGFVERCRQLTEARADNAWLAGGSATVQQQAVKDHAQAMKNFFKGTHRRPSWRKAGRDESFRVTGARGGQWDFRRVGRHWGEVKIPRAGWVRFRWSRAVPEGVKSFRVTRDYSGRWHVAFAAIPKPIPGPGTGEVVGIDRGVKVAAALSTGEMLAVPGLSGRERRRLVKLERKLAKAKRGANRRGKVKVAVARLKARETDMRKDWVEKTSIGLARRFDVIRVEDLKVKKMTRSAKGTREEPGRNVAQKAGLNREIRKAGWGMLVQRLEHKAPGRVEKVPAAYTSQRCSACGHIARESRKSQALFRCVACDHTLNADVNAARNIAAGHAVKARGGDAVRRPVNREPQLPLLVVLVEIPRPQAGRMSSGEEALRTSGGKERIAIPVIVVDVANVMGARPDGWWRDRAGAALRLGREVAALARQEGGLASAWVLVLEGRARDAAPLLAAEFAGTLVDVLSAPGSGDDAIAGVAAEAVAREGSCLVVTADRELRQRCEELNASVAGPGWLLGRL